MQLGDFCKTQWHFSIFMGTVMNHAIPLSKAWRPCHKTLLEKTSINSPAFLWGRFLSFEIIAMLLSELYLGNYNFPTDINPNSYLMYNMNYSIMK